MGRYVLRKIGRTIIVLLLVSFGTSMMLELVDGDPAYTILGDAATPEAVQQVHQQLGLDKPVLERYVDWVGDVARGDFGSSFFSGEKVFSLVRTAIPVTAEIVFLTMVVALAVAIPLAMISASRAGGWLDRTITTISSFFVSIPPFVSVPILALLFVIRRPHLPAIGWVPLTESPFENIRHLILPVIALAITEIPVFAAALRSDMISTLGEDFILNARAKGVSPRRVLMGHAFRPSSFSLVTLLGVEIGRLIGGAVVVEFLFVLPGIGSLVVRAINSNDIPLVQGLVMFIAIGYVVINMLVDIAYRVLDPRVGGS